jgi:hypothetical protein
MKLELLNILHFSKNIQCFKFDWLSPEYCQSKTSKTIRQWIKEVNFQDIEILKIGRIVSCEK